jgi:hypothetical protein
MAGGRSSRSTSGRRHSRPCRPPPLPHACSGLDHRWARDADSSRRDAHQLDSEGACVDRVAFVQALRARARALGSPLRAAGLHFRAWRGAAQPPCHRTPPPPHPPPPHPTPQGGGRRRRGRRAQDRRRSEETCARGLASKPVNTTTATSCAAAAMAAFRVFPKGRDPVSPQTREACPNRASREQRAVRVDASGPTTVVCAPTGIVDARTQGRAFAAVDCAVSPAGNAACASAGRPERGSPRHTRCQRLGQAVTGTRLPRSGEAIGAPRLSGGVGSSRGVGSG